MPLQWLHEGVQLADGGGKYKHERVASPVQKLHTPAQHPSTAQSTRIVRKPEPLGRLRVHAHADAAPVSVSQPTTTQRQKPSQAPNPVCTHSVDGPREGQPPSGTAVTAPIDVSELTSRAAPAPAPSVDASLCVRKAEHAAQPLPQQKKAGEITGKLSDRL